MNWQAVGAIGEILGAVGVIVTLWYLARQIRASTRASRQAAGQEVTEGTRAILSQIAHDQETASLWRRGLAGDEGLSLDEQAQFRAIVTQLAYAWERLHYFNEEGALDPWILETHRTTRRNIAGTPGFRAWFEVRKDWLSAAFREALEEDVRRDSGYRPFGLLTENKRTAGDPDATGAEARAD